MKKLLTTLTLWLAFVATAQAQEFDERLLVRFSSDQLKEMNANDPQELRLLTYALDHALYTADLPKGKSDAISELAAIGSKNFLELGLEIKDINQYFRIAGTEEVLVVKSRWVLNHELTKNGGL